MRKAAKGRGRRINPVRRRPASDPGALGHGLARGAGIAVAAGLDVHAARAALAMAVHVHHAERVAAARAAGGILSRCVGQPRSFRGRTATPAARRGRSVLRVRA